MGTWQSHSQGYMVHAEGSPVLQAGTFEVGLAGTVVEVDLSNAVQHVGRSITRLLPFPHGRAERANSKHGPGAAFVGRAVGGTFASLSFVDSGPPGGHHPALVSTGKA